MGSSYPTLLIRSLSFSQQPARFSNRCLQTIGRCWPHLRALGVGGAGCGIQGLASLGKCGILGGSREVTRAETTRVFQVTYWSYHILKWSRRMLESDWLESVYYFHIAYSIWYVAIKSTFVLHIGSHNTWFVFLAIDKCQHPPAREQIFLSTSPFRYKEKTIPSISDPSTSYFMWKKIQTITIIIKVKIEHSESTHCITALYAEIGKWRKLHLRPDDKVMYLLKMAVFQCWVITGY